MYLFVINFIWYLFLIYNYFVCIIGVFIYCMDFKDVVLFLLLKVLWGKIIFYSYVICLGIFILVVSIVVL